MLKRITGHKDIPGFPYGKNAHESVYFYTFHKCASTLFSGYVLKHIRGLQHIDYAKLIYRGKTDNITFEINGFVYGPIRLSADPLSPVYKQLVAPASDTVFIKDKIAIFLIRDPRDILVSAYHSFGYTHGISPNNEIREVQDNRRREIQSMTIDEYSMKSTHNILDHYITVDKLSNACDRSVVLRYEDMINNWDTFAKGLTRHMNIGRSSLKHIYRESRPQEKEDNTSHRRSGMPGGFRYKLQNETLAYINSTFAEVLERYHYET